MLPTLRTAFRSLKNRLGITAIHVIGLALGLACCLLLGQYALHEWGYDDFHPEADRLVRVTLKQTSENGTVERAVAPPALGPALVREASAVESAVRISKVGTRNPATIQVPSSPGAPRVFESSDVIAADSTFFELFGFGLQRGDPTTVLDAPSDIVLAPAMANRLFGSPSEAMGQALTIRAGRLTLDLTVSGIAEAVPSNTHLDFQAVISHRGFQQAMELGDTVWRLFGAYTYARLAPGATEDGLQAQLDALADAHMTFGAERGTSFAFVPQAITDVHLRSHKQSEFQPNNHAGYVLLFGLVGLLVLGIACINFTNLATAKAAQRVTEVGVRKAIGAQAHQVAQRFLAEALLLSLAALGVALVLVSGALPLFNRLTRLDFAFTGFLTGWTPLVVLAVAVGTGLAAGGYPAFYLSRFAPTDVLRGSRGSRGSEGTGLRKGLVVVQFAASIVLLIGAAGVHQQLTFMQDANLGFDTSRLVRIDNSPVRSGQISPDAARQEIEALPGVERMTMAMWGPSQMTMTNSEIIPEGRDNSTAIVWSLVDAQYTETLDLDVIAGRSFEPGRAADSSAFLVNQAAAQQFGWTNPVGKKLRTPADGSVIGEVVGVVPDAHFQSLQHAVEPAVFGLAPGPQALRTALVRLAPGNPQATLDAIRATYRQWDPATPFSYAFVDDAYDAKYTAERQVRTLIGLFAGVAVAVACLGLLGLAAHNVQQRRREIGIRKALGATARQIVGLLSWDLLKPVGIAFVLAAPLAYLGLERWLSTFAYRTDVGAGLLLGIGAAASLVAVATVGWQAARAARVDPARTLRSE